jgi:hypothetical protein
MSPFWGRTVRRSLFVSGSLAVVGYLLGQAFLFAYRIQGGGTPSPENERVLWQTPVTMGVLGLILTVGTEAVAEMFRKPAKQAIKNP